ncbi:hypothetical protein M9435_005339 [Picochlorum sp. BPE23]|nr:hypothetical protein M9435_005339 [Picochlorum sp. BPE23]
MPFEAAPLSTCDVDSLPILIPQHSMGCGSSVPPLGDDLYAALNDASLTDVMESDVSQMQDLLPLQPYGSVGLLEIADEFEGINGPGQGSIERGTCSTAGPLVHDGKFDEPQMDLGASDCAWNDPGAMDAFGMGPSSRMNNSSILIRSSNDFENGGNENVHPMVPVQTQKPWMDSEEGDDSVRMLPKTPMAGTAHPLGENWDMLVQSTKEGSDDDGSALDDTAKKSKSLRGMRHVPLAVALLNLQCLQAGAALCYQASWQGCPSGAWCSMSPGHFGMCDTSAVVPGPGAYLPEELEALGIRTEDGSWMDIPLPEAAAALAESVKGKSLEEARVAPVETSQGVNKPAVRQSTRRRMRRKVDDDDGYDFGSSDDDSVNPTGPESMEIRQSSRLSRASSKKQIAPVTTRSKRASAQRSYVNIAAQQQKNRRGGRVPSRRAPQVWIKGEVRDPRTGMMISDVPPGVFCTQCTATTTPVWRAGPFGHKTLCNACGVRWMKVDPKKK